MPARTIGDPAPRLRLLEGMGSIPGFSFTELSQEAKNRERYKEPIWPKPFNQDTPESAWLFLMELRTYVETTGEVLEMPDEEYLECYCHIWHECKCRGTMLACEKCRRMLISWAARGLELHQMGLGRCDQILAGLKFDKAAAHVWRLEHLYKDLQMRHPEWDLPPSTTRLYDGERKLKSFSLPNGSVCNYANAESGGLQGDGTRIVTMEEAGLFRKLSEMVGQAKILTIGPAGTGRGGVLINLITNTPPMDAPSFQEWQKIKEGWKDIPVREAA